MRAAMCVMLGLGIGVAAGCPRSRELPPDVEAPAAPDRQLSPRGVRVGGAVVSSEGGTFMVSPGGRAYAQTIVSVAAGVFSEPTPVEALLLPRRDDPKQEMPQLLAVVAERPFGAGAVTVTVLRRELILGVEPERQRLLGYASGLGGWQAFDEPTVGAPLQGDLGTLRSAAAAAQETGMVVIGETTGDPAGAVRAGARAVSAGLASLDYDLTGGGSDVVSPDEGRRLMDRLNAGAAFVVFKGTAPLGYLWLTPPTIRGADEPPELRELLCHGADPRVLLTHGVVSHTDGFEGDGDLIRGLARQGMRVGRYVYPTGSPIADNGAALASLLAHVRGGCERGPGDLDVVGHSMGGLVIRSAMQDHGAPIRRAVLVSTPNGGGRLTRWIGALTGDGESLSSAPVAAIQASSPGLGVDLLEGSSFLEGLNEPSAVRPIADRLYVVAGWSSKDLEPQPNDSVVEVRSALLLDLPAGHEHYATEGDEGAPRLVEQTGELPPSLEGRAADRFGHRAIHEQASTNGVLDHVARLLVAAEP